MDDFKDFLGEKKTKDMKINKNFQIKNIMWPAIVLGVLIIGAIWTNAGFNMDPVAPVENPVLAPFMTNKPDQAVVQNQKTTSEPSTALNVQEGISHVVSQIKPSVVGVHRTGTAVAGNENNAGLSSLGPFTSGTGSVGSGIIIDARGYIVTSFKTVGRDKLVNITFFSTDKQKYQADVVAVDPATDLAVLKIRGAGVFQAAVLGNSDLLEVGDIVFAFGSPFGFSQTVTMGIVSSHNRSLNINGIGYPDMIQTDVAINQGNDGGPLVNVKGQVVGINMATYMPDNHYSGIGFAIPINDILHFINENI